MKFIIIFCFLFLIVSGFNANTRFIVTRQLYNGSVTYNGLFQACKLECPYCRPCTVSTLENYFWTQSIPASWYLKLDYNCVGYTTDKSYSMGGCVDSKFNIVTQCTCDMNIPICCYV